MMSSYPERNDIFVSFSAVYWLLFMQKTAFLGQNMGILKMCVFKYDGVLTSHFLNETHSKTKNHRAKFYA